MGIRRVSVLEKLKKEEIKIPVFLAVSLFALIAGFFDISLFNINLSWIAILLCGIPIIKGAVEALITEFDIKADVLVSIALIASVCIGEVFAAGEIAFIMTIGAYLEERTVSKAKAGIERLVKLTPATARIVVNGEIKEIQSKDVKKGDILRVLAGETIPVDGKIIKGKTSIDQSVMTGESIPAEKEEGDEVLSGTINRFGNFEMTALKVGEDSSLQRMIRLVESADAGKAKIVRLADSWATWIVIIALASAAGTWFVTGEIIRSVTILVVFCPCALVLATPTAIVAAIGNASKRGVLIRKGDALERLAKVNCVVFDKTGTLTQAILTVTEIESIDVSSDELIKLAARAEVLSEHPLGKAITRYYKEKTGCNPEAPDEFKMMPGYGVFAKISGKELYAGNEKMLKKCEVAADKNIMGKAEAAKKKGSTIIYVIFDNQFIGYLSLSDSLRAGIENIVDEIHKCGAETFLATGDNHYCAQHIAFAAGIKNVEAGCLPEDKINVIKAKQNEKKFVCMVGDGINDAPALKCADVGISMGSIGSDIAIDASDIVLTGDNIKEIPFILKLAKKTMKTIKINLTAAMILNFAAIIFAMTGDLTPVMGALVHNIGSVAVILNSSLLLKWRK